MLVAVRRYWEEITKRKVRLCVACLISIFLFSVSCQYLYSGFNKRFLLYTVLSLSTGCFLVCPRIKNRLASFLPLILYCIIAPGKIFQRIELPVHDMSRILEGAEFANIMILFLIYAVFLLVLQRVCLALGAGNIFLLILFIINYYVNQFRGSSLSITDLMATGTAMTVLDNYKLTMSGELWYSILWFCFFIAWGFWCDIPVKGKKYHVAVSAVSVSCLLLFFLFWYKTDYLERNELQGHYWNMSENEALNGFLLSFAISMKENSMDKPADYSEETLIQLVEGILNTHQQSEKRDAMPNIICIMNEAWSDLRVLGNLQTSEPFMPFYDSLTTNVVKGNTYVEVLGGLTANTEFEVLTGDSLAFLAPAAIPYQLQVNHDMYSMARVLRDQGYQTMAMHPSTGEAWNRNTVYHYFGFEEFKDASQFETDYLYVGNFLSDECNFNEIIRQYENREKEKPFFLFDVTIQNHADYYGNTDILFHVESVGDLPVEEVGYIYDADTYLNLMRLTDDAFRNMLSYFEKEEEPVIICMFGDHQPKLNDEFYKAIFHEKNLSEEEERALMYITPYVIWANYDVEFPEYGEMSANYLGAAVLECAGVELPPYYQFLLDLQKQYPVISRYTIDGIKEDEAILQYQILQYNHLMAENFQEKLFMAVQ